MAEDKDIEPSGPAPGKEVSDEDRFLSTEKEYQTEKARAKKMEEVTKGYRVEKEEQHQVEKNMPWFKRIFARQREKFPSAPPAPPTEEAKAEILRKQSYAGQAGQPELTVEERRKIQEINFPSTPLTDEEKALLKKQGTAGIGGQPELTPEERQRVAEINSRQGRQIK